MNKNLQPTNLITVVKMYSTVAKLRFSEWLQEQMDRNDWSQTDLAERSGLSPGAIGNLVREERNPSPDSLIALAHALKISPEEIFRIAGLLPELEERNQLLETINHLAAQLPPEDRQDVAEYIRLRLRFAEERGRYSAPGDHHEPAMGTTE